MSASSGASWYSYKGCYFTWEFTYKNYRMSVYRAKIPEILKIGGDEEILIGEVVKRKPFDKCRVFERIVNKYWRDYEARRKEVKE